MNAIAPSRASSLLKTSRSSPRDGQAAAPPSTAPARTTRLMTATASRTVLGDPSRQRDRLVDHLRTGNHAVHQPDLPGALGLDGVSGQGDLEREGERDAGGEQRASTTGQQAALDLGEAELRVVGGDHEVALEHQLEAPTHRAAVQRGDDRLREVGRHEGVRDAGVVGVLLGRGLTA